MSGYMGKILDVDLSRNSYKILDLDMDIAKRFIGGRGLGAYLLWERLPAHADPLDKDAPLMFLLGPISGLLPGGAQLCTFFKSPETGVTLCHSIVGSHFGVELKSAGFDGIIITGKAEKPVYLKIFDHDISFEDASHLWGKSTFNTEKILKKELNNHRVKMLSIGIAGENGVRFAGIQHDYYHSAARGGSGCLMGSKNLKAIVVKGSKGFDVAEPEEFYKVYNKIFEMLKRARTEERRGYYLVRWGSSAGSMWHSDVSELDVKNYREAHWEDIDKISGFEFERKSKVKNRGCYLCPFSCMQLGVIRDGKHAGRTATPDFDSTSTIGAGCLVTDHDGLIYLNSLGDELGIDNISLGNVTSFTMECYERGIITKDDLGGIDLTWGNVEAMEALWNLIVQRKGIGEILSLGVKKAAETFGKGAEHFAMHCKGLEFGAYATQAKHERGLQFAVGDRGGCHHYGLTIKEQNHRVMADSLLVCTWHRHFITPDIYMDALNAATGFNFAHSDWDLLAERFLILARAYNLREGIRPLKDDILPLRVHNDPLTSGPQKGAVYPIEKFKKDRENWYKIRGMNSEGIPTKEHLKELDLEFVIETLEKEGLYK